MKTTKVFFLALAAVSFILTACEPAEEPTNVTELQGIKLNQTAVTLEEGESVKLRVRYTPEEAAATAPAVVWYSEKQRVASVDDNGLVTADRPGTTVITAQCGKFEAKCTVDVLQKDLPEPDPTISFSVEPKKIDAPAEGGTFALSVKSNVSWTAELENSEWASLSATSGDGDAEITLTVDGTEETEVASQDITFQVGRGKYYVRVTRAGYVKVTKFVLDKEYAEIGIDGGTITVNVEADEEWTATCDADAPHITISKTATTATINVGKFTLTANQWSKITGIIFDDPAEDLGFDFNFRRKMGYRVYFTCGEKTITFWIYQDVPYIGTQVTSGSFQNSDGYTDVVRTTDYKAHYFTVKVESNVPWKIDVIYNTQNSCGMSNWMSVSQYSGTGDATISISFTDNSESDCDHREGKIVFTNTGGYTYFTKTYETFQAGPNWKPAY